MLVHVEGSPSQSVEKASTTREIEEYSDDEDSTDPFEEPGVDRRSEKDGIKAQTEA